MTVFINPIPHKGGVLHSFPRASVFSQIQAYYVADFSTSYKWKNWKLEAGITSFTNNSYFTRRATGYPGPGIIPSDTRTFYTTLEFVF
ncbi:hypothetical protein [Flavobacterium sp. ZB4P13]|uniref:hypothetical protein n=1 Tax=Flavobacterium sp. ZB4P13 TaxID=3401728 RepID=UPI003AAD3402